MTFKEKKLPLTGFHLKYIAILTMTIDHYAAIFLPYHSLGYTLCRGIGRIAFPIYCFLLVEGFLHTKSRKAYALRLFLFALISEIPFDMAFFHFPKNTSFALLFSHQNVFFTLSFAILAMELFERYWLTRQSAFLIGTMLLAFFAEIFSFDYGLTGVLVVMVFFICKRIRTEISPLFMAVLGTLPLIHFQTATGICPALCIPFLLLYNGEKGRPLPGGKTYPGAKYLFYLYYPAHLVLFGLLI